MISPCASTVGAGIASSRAPLGDHMKLDDENWHCFTLSRYELNSGEWAMEKAPVYHIID